MHCFLKALEKPNIIPNFLYKKTCELQHLIKIRKVSKKNCLIWLVKVSKLVVCFFLTRKFKSEYDYFSFFRLSLI